MYRRALKCGNDNYWYTATDVFHQERWPYPGPTFTGESIPTFLKCFTCQTTWEMIQDLFKPEGKYAANMVLVQGLDFLEVS